MAIKPKGNKVTGTNNADKITWINSQPWKRTLVVNAGNGNDKIDFKKSKYKSKLYGQNGNDSIYGGTNNDTIYGGNGNDKIYGYNGKDVIYSGAGSDYIDSGADNDVIYAQSGNNTIKGGVGNDSIYVYEKGFNDIDAGAGNDLIYNDVTYAPAVKSKIKAGVGNDTVCGGVKNDSIWGGSGNDYIDIRPGGNNRVYGEAGNDTIVFSLTNNYIDGGVGDDYITGVGGYNTIKGGNGNDTIYYDYSMDNVNRAIVDGGSGHDYIDVSGTKSSHVLGGDGHDTIYGSSDYTNGNDYINGGAGNDVIYGYRGNNTLYGGAGNDTIYSSGELYENDLINGGSGINHIHIDSFGHNDTITSGGQDAEDTLFLDAHSGSFSALNISYVGAKDLLIIDEAGNRVLLKDYTDGHSVKNVVCDGVMGSLESIITNNMVANARYSVASWKASESGGDAVTAKIALVDDESNAIPIVSGDLLNINK